MNPVKRQMIGGWFMIVLPTLLVVFHFSIFAPPFAEMQLNVFGILDEHPLKKSYCWCPLNSFSNPVLLMIIPKSV